MSIFRIELDDGTGTFVVMNIDAETQEKAEDLAIEQTKLRPGADAELVVIVTATPV